MNNGGDAAEQIVRMSLEGVEVAAKITGAAAKEIAVFLVAALKNKNSSLKLKGKARLTSMLKSGKALEIFSVKESDLQKFAQGAKQYGIVYCVLRNSKHSQDGLCDVMVKADDAPKINRVVERFKFATVDKAKIESEIVKTKAEKSAAKEPEAPDRNDTEKLVNDLLPPDEGKVNLETEKVAQKGAQTPANPEAGKTSSFQKAVAKSRPSAPTSESKSKSAGVISSKPSVKEELREIKAAQAKKEADALGRNEKAVSDTPKSKTTSTTHKQPTSSRKLKSNKSKERS